MPNREIYKAIRPSVVAFVSKFTPVSGNRTPMPPFPTIIGTGFVVHSDGLIATNAHVVNLFDKVPKPDDLPPDNWPVLGLLFHMLDAGQAEIPLEVRGVVTVKSFEPGKVYYGPKEGPDIALVQVNLTGLPALALDEESLIEEGMDVLTAGYPMGTNALTAPGWLHQISPTLQKGIVSAVLPYAGVPKPHAFSIDVMSQGGASGSPVLSCETGRVIGMLHAGLTDWTPTSRPDTLCCTPTSISYIVPAHYIVHFVQHAHEDLKIRARAGSPTLSQVLSTADLHNAFESGRAWDIWSQTPPREIG